MACLKRAVEEGVPITSAKYISTIDETKLRKIFRSENEVSSGSSTGFPLAFFFIFFGNLHYQYKFAQNF